MCERLRGNVRSHYRMSGKKREISAAKDASPDGGLRQITGYVINAARRKPEDLAKREPFKRLSFTNELLKAGSVRRWIQFENSRAVLAEWTIVSKDQRR